MWSFSHLPGGLELFADSNSIPENQPTIFHPGLIATVQQSSLLLFCEPPSQQYHLSRNGEALRYNDSRITLHRLCQIPRKCPYEWLLACPTARETSVNSFPFLGEIYLVLHGYDCDHCNVGSLARFAISVLRQVTKNTVFRQYHFFGGFRIWFTRSACGCVPWCWHSFVH